MKRTFLTLLFFCPILLHAQGGILLRQFFKPGVKVGVETMPQSLTNSDNPYLNLYSSKASLVVPIKSKLGVKLKPKELIKLENLKALKNIKDWKTIPKLALKIIEPNAHQIFMNFNAGYTMMDGTIRPDDTQTYEPFNIQLYRFSAGVTGIHYRKNMRVLFYSGDLGFMESSESFSTLHPNVNALVGMGKIHSPFKFTYYGVYLGYANGKILPIPFAGIDFRVANKARLNLTFPIQAKLSFKTNKKTRLALLAQYTGFASGLDNDNDENLRVHQNHSYLKTTGILERKLNKEVKLFVEAGWSVARRTGWNGGTELFAKNNIRIFPYKGAPYFHVSVYRSFGKSLFDSSIGNLLNL